jgi:LuxR family maltose regulon positive regulatory protein
MSSAVSTTGVAFPDLFLKTTPPRAPRHQLVRPRLSLDGEQLSDCAVTVVQAPAGFGKTALLGQWRREYLARGAAVAWVSADERDDLKRFLHSLVLAVRTGCARPAFGRQLLEGALAPITAMEGITAWLAEVAQSALDLVLIVDEAERLPETTLTALIYLVHNVPSNLRVVVASRGGLEEAVADLVAYGQCLAVEAEMLRFRLDETIALVRERFGAKVDADTCARLQDLTEGWPLGLQLALTAIQQGGDPRGALGTISAPTGQMGEHLLGRLIARLAPDDVEFLTRIAVVDLVHPDLARALTGLDEAPEHLERLIRDTPVFLVNDDSEWCRLHTLARDTLRLRLADLPAADQVALHTRAMGWLADHGLIHEAARHAYAAGQREIAYDLAEQCLYEEAMAKGHQETVLEWLDLLPAEELDHRPRLRLAVAWALALSERNEEADRLVARILEAPGVDAALRYECALIASGAAYYADDPDRCVSLFEPWLDSPPQRDPRLLQMHANRLGMIAILQGDPARARLQQQAAHRGAFGEAQGYAAGRVGDFIVGLSYLWEGQVRLAEEALRPALASADADLGRRHPMACMLAAVLAAALYEGDRPEQAAGLLANRLDMLERVGTPETAFFGYRTAARIAAVQGVEHRALDLL